jgi:hypothetical protein
LHQLADGGRYPDAVLKHEYYVSVDIYVEIAEPVHLLVIFEFVRHGEKKKI